MKKRILYIILGMMLLSNVGVGQSFTFDVSSGYYIFPDENCDQVIFSVNNPSSSSISLEIFYSNDGIVAYSRLPTGYSIPANSLDYTFPVYQTGFYYVRWKNGATVIQTSSNKRITINALPVAGTITGTNEVCVGLTTPLTSNPTGGSGTYSSTLWSTSAPSKGTISTTGIVTGVASGSTSITYTVTDSKGCESSPSAAYTVTVNAKPVAGTITGTNEVCVGKSTALATGAIIVGSGTISSTVWSSSVPSKGTINTTGLVTGVAGGITSITYTVTNSNGCVSLPSAAYSITVNTLPLAGDISGGSEFCKNLNFILSANVTGGAAPYAFYIWDGDISNAPVYTTDFNLQIDQGANPAIYGINYAVVDSKGCRSNTSNDLFVTIRPVPPKPTLTSPIICEGSIANVTMTTPTSTNTYTYTWQVPAGVATSTTNSLTTTKAGTYSLTITDVNNCISEVGTGIVTVNNLPTKPTLTSSTICEGQSTSVSMSLPTGTYTYTWQVPTGVSTSTTNTVSTTKAGTYSLTITNANNCTSEVGNATVTVNSLPTKPTLTSSTICEGQTTNVSMSLPTGTYTYTWQVPTGVATSTTKTVSTTKAGTYSLTITDANSCTSEVGTGIVTVNALPAKPTLTSQEICEGATATITGPTGTYTYTWQVPTGVATSTTSTVSTSKAGTYSLTITDANSCTSEVGTATVTVNALPTKPTLTSSTICEGQSTSVTMSLPAGTYTYTWQVPSGVATSTTNTVSTSKAGTYSLTITDVNSCSSEVGTATVVVHVLPAKPTLTSPTICEGETASITMLTPTGTNTYTYTWTVPSGVASSTTNTVSTSKAGTYSLTITDANSCTSEVGTGTVTVNPLPTLTITNPAAVCAPGTIDLTASTITAGSTASLTYTYFTNAIATSTLTNTSLIGTSGTYYIKGTSSFNCSAIKSVNTIINTIPSFNVLSPSVCVGAPLTISANPFTGRSSDYDYTWEVPTGVANPGNVSSFTTTTAGVYTATIKNKSTTCESATLNNIVTFYPLPIAATIVATNNKVIANSTLNLTAAATGGTSPYRFTWVPNPSIYYSISGQENAVFTALKEGKVKFKYQVKDANNCEVNSAEYEITIDPADIVLVLPNAFTPNGDGNNDEFKIVATNTLGEKSFVYFEIYNRNGKLLTNKITDIKAGWNGRSLEGIMQDMGVYFVKLVKLNKDGQQVVETSPIYLLK